VAARPCLIFATLPVARGEKLGMPKMRPKGKHTPTRAPPAKGKIPLATIRPLKILLKSQGDHNWLHHATLSVNN
jgi:hypothetical protein